MIRQRPGIRLVGLDASLAEEAALLATDQGLRGADAVYLAVAARFGLPVVTWDLEMMHRAPAGVRVQMP
jgi:predicted nucleic acid-binding protein